MPIIKYMTKLEKVFRKAVFTPQDLHQEDVPEGYAKKLLHLLVKKGKIKHIERGKYTSSDDPLAVAAHITEPCYLSLWTALSIHKLTTQIPFGIEVVTSRRRFTNRILFDGTPIIFYTVPPRMMFGFEHIVWKGNIRITIAKPEKIVIDAIYTKTIPEEDILDIVEVSDISLLKKYAKLTGNNKIKERVKKLCLHRKR